MSNGEIAAKYSVHEITVSKIYGKFRKGAPEAEISRGLAGYRDRIKEKSVVAIEAGLDDPVNSYKRAGIGVQVMKGIGEFVPDQGPVGIQMIMERCPSEWRQRYGLVSRDAEPVAGELAATGEDVAGSKLAESDTKVLKGNRN